MLPMSVLRKPYPKDSTIKKKVVFSLLFGLFVFLFLQLFQPFGLSEWKTSHKIFRLAGYGVITVVMLLFNFLVIESIFSKWFAESNWKVWKEIVWSLCNILIIAVINTIYSHWQIGFSLTFMGFLSYLWITLLIGLFPVTIGTFINYSRLQKRNLNAAVELSKVIELDFRSAENTSHKSPIELVGEGGRESICLHPDSIIYIEAADNYVEIFWIEGGKIQKKLLRSTLKNLEISLANTQELFRCHRSFIVNLSHVKKVSGNSQGYKLHFQNTEKEVPVSRQFNELIRQKLSKIHSAHPN